MPLQKKLLSIHKKLLLTLLLSSIVFSSVNVSAKDIYSQIFTVYFDSVGGIYISPQQVPYGSPVQYLPIPTKEGYKFKGWYTSSNYEDEYVRSTPLYKDTTLFARWEAYSLSGSETAESWKGIIQKINSLSEGKTLNIEMISPILPTTVLSAIKGRDIYLRLDFTYYSWLICGTDITTVEPINFSLSLTQLLYTSYKSDYDLLDTTLDPMLELTLANEENLPPNSKLSLFIHKDFEDYYANVFYKDDAKLNYSYEQSTLIDRNGNMNVDLNKEYSYAILLTDFIPQKIQIASKKEPSIAKSFTVKKGSTLNLKSQIKDMPEPVIVTCFTTNDVETATASFYSGIIKGLSKGTATIYIEIDTENETYMLVTNVIVK